MGATATKSQKRPTARSPKRSTAAAAGAGTPSQSRAVLRDVEPGSSVDCIHCGERVKFQAKIRNKQVICNVYVGGRWDRVEHFHHDCYEQARMPYGEADTTPPAKFRKARAEAAAKK